MLRGALVGLAVLACALASAAPSALAATGDINTVAGNGFFGYAGDGGQATSAQMRAPAGVAFGATGELFIADFYAHTVRKVAPGGVITTAAGTGSAGYGGDGGPATSALLNQPGDVVTDAAGNLYIADYGNSRVRKVGVNGIITTFAGTGVPGYSGDGGPAVMARLGYPIGLDIDSVGNLYVADYGNHTVRRITPGGVISTVAGRGFAGYSGDGGPATLAAMSQPADVAVDGAGNVFIAEFSGQRVRKVTAAGIISTVAGTGVQGYSGTGGPATSAQLSNPAGVDVDSTGSLFIAEFGNHVVRKVSPSGTITRVAGIVFAGFSGDGGPATSAQLNSPSRVTLSPDGDFYISDWNNRRVRYVDTLGAPDAPSLTATSPTSPASSNSPRVSGTSPSGSTVRLYTSATCTSGVAASGTAADFTSPGLSVTVPDDSTTTFYATATDSGGNVSGCSSRSITYVEDSTPPPAPSIGFGPLSPGNDVTPDWSFSAEPGASTECRLARGTTVLSDWAACSSPKSYDLSAQPDGSYTFSVRQTDTAGNLSAASTSTYELDTSAPGAPSIGPSPPSPGNDQTPTWGFSGEPGAGFGCRLTRGTTVISDWAPCTSPRSYDVSGEPDGDYTFAVRQTDTAGNRSAASTSTYELDTSPPGAPTIDSDPGATGANTTPAWGFSGEPGAGFGCRLTRGTTVVSDWAPCTSPRSYDVSGEPDGNYTFAVRQTDTAGNVGAPATHVYALDRSGPQPPVIDSLPPSPSSSAAPSWGFSGEAGATFECRLSSMSGVVSAWGTCSSAKSYDLSAQPDGSYTFSVRQTDTAGATSPASNAWYTYDTTAPAAPSVDSAPPSPGSDPLPSWTFSTEAGATLECRLSRGATTVSDWTSCSSPRSYDLSGEPDGTYTLAVRATDAAGNTGAATGSDYELDRVAPGAPALTTTPGALGNDSSPTWTFDADAGTSSECRLQRGAAVVSDWQACSGSVTYDLSAQPDGQYRFHARSTDGAGNVSPVTTFDHELDRTAPVAPSIDSGPGAVGASRTPSWGFTEEQGAAYECRLRRAGTVVADWAPCASPAGYDLAGQPDDTYTFEVRGRDAAGNTGSTSGSDYRLDTTGADTAIEAGPGPLGSDASPSWSFAGEPGARFDCMLERAGSVVADWTPCTSPQGFDLSAEPDGNYTFRVRSRDEADNVGAPVSYEYEMDRVAPGAPEFTDSPGALGNDTTPRWAFTAEAGALEECRLVSGAGTGRPWEPCADERSHDLGLERDGTYSLVVRATDRAGNTGPLASSDYRLDATAPDAPAITDDPGARGRDRRVSWAFTGEPAATFQCRLARGSTILDGWTSCAGRARFDLADTEPGEHTFRVRSRDEAGNLGPAARSDYELLASRERPDPAPDDEPPPGDGPRGNGDQPPTSPNPTPGAPLTPAPAAPVGDAPASGASADPSPSAENGSEPPKPRRNRQREPDRERDAAGGIPLDDGGTPGAGPAPEGAPDDGEGLGQGLVGALGDAARWVGRNLDKTGFPLLLVLLVAGYMAVQNRLDRRDPKLALAPVHADKDLEFLPPPRLGGAAAGSLTP